MTKLTYNSLASEIRQFFLDNAYAPGTNTPLTVFTAASVVISKLTDAQVAEVITDALKKPKPLLLQRGNERTEVFATSLPKAVAYLLWHAVEATILDADKVVAEMDKRRRKGLV
jgi:hypothetical protein